MKRGSDTRDDILLFYAILEKQIYRKRKQGVLKVDKEDKEDGGEAEDVPPPQEEVEKPTKKDDDEKQKKKSDDLWASFLSDVGSRPKESTPASQSSTTQTVTML